MKKVNLYTIASTTCPRKGQGDFLYILATTTNFGEATITRKEHFEEVTANELYILGMVSALKHITEPCELFIFVESDFMFSALDQWLVKWVEADWKNAKGDLIAHSEKWKELHELISKHEIRVFGRREQHEYKMWLKNEVQKNG